MGNIVYIEDTKNAHNILTGILNVKRSCRKIFRTWEDNIHMYGFDSTCSEYGNI
jgi:hypothetical protein